MSRQNTGRYYSSNKQKIYFSFFSDENERSKQRTKLKDSGNL